MRSSVSSRFRVAFVCKLGVLLFFVLFRFRASKMENRKSGTTVWYRETVNTRTAQARYRKVLVSPFWAGTPPVCRRAARDPLECPLRRSAADRAARVPGTDTLGEGKPAPAP